MNHRIRWGLGLLLAVAGCGPTAEPTDAGSADTGARDTGVTLDTGTTTDTGVAADTGAAIDAGVDAATITVDAGSDAFVAADGGPTTGCELTGYPALTTQELRSSGDLVTGLVQAPGRDDIFVVERNGRVRIMDPRTGAVAATPFLDINSLVGSSTSPGDERGLLGMAFDPDFATNGLFFVGLTPHSGSQNRVAVGHVSAATPNVADGGVLTILAINDFASNHNGGQLQFGPDGFLYVATGDGGNSGDPMENGQDNEQLLGKILRIDVSATAYTSPSTNPFAGVTAGRDEIWAYGVRNPWRFSFDRRTGDMLIADVGQGLYEEIDFVAAGTGAGDNFGWNVCEGTHDYESGDCSALAGHHAPIYEYSHGGSAPIRGGSITGGYVYRGSAIPALNGAYFFGDATSDMVAALRYCDGAVREPTRIESLSGLGGPTTFGEDANGEILIGLASGAVLRIIAD